MPILSHQFDSIQPGIFMDVVVSVPGSNEKWSVRALWDTGANVTVISETVAENLGLKPKGLSKLIVANGAQNANLYKIDFSLSKDIVFKDVFVRGCGNDSVFEMAIGMDVISRGNFHIDNRDGKTLFTFEID